jgi:predicted GNAT family N-acyltransferase
MSKNSYGFYLSKWENDKSKIMALRQKVLLKELGIAADSLENNKDPDSFHVIAYNDASEPIGTGCINSKGQLGFLMVLDQWRRRRVGMAIVKYLLFIAKRLNLPSVTVESPQAAVNFYLSAGFEKTDHSYEQDGIHYCKLIKMLEIAKPIVH